MSVIRLTEAERRQIEAQRMAQEIVGGDELVPIPMVALAKEVMALRQQLRGAVEALRKYGQHQRTCDLLERGAVNGGECDCGWSDFWSASPCGGR